MKARHSAADHISFLWDILFGQINFLTLNNFFNVLRDQIVEIGLMTVGMTNGDYQ